MARRSGASAGDKGKRKRGIDIDEGEEGYRFAGEMFRFDEPPQRYSIQPSFEEICGLQIYTSYFKAASITVADRIKELKNHPILVECNVLTGDPVRDLWRSKCVDAVQKALNKGSSAEENESNDNHDACVSAFTMQLLACFESSAYKELRVDLEKYNGIMDLFSFNIERLNEMSAASSALKTKLLSPIHEMSERKTKMLRKTGASLILLDRRGRAHVTLDGDFRWSNTEITSRGVRFKLSLRAQEPPCTSSLLFKTIIPADIISSCKRVDIADFLVGPLSTEFYLIVMSSHNKAILLKTMCAGGTDIFVMEQKVTDYFMMDPIDFLPPALIHLAAMPPCMKCHPGLSLMCHNNSYVVAALEQGCKEWYISFFSSSGNSWGRKLVCLPPDLNSWHCWELTVVLVCNGKFWWVDLRRGLLSCTCDHLLQENGTQQQPLTLEFTLLPNISMKMAKEACLSKYPLLRDQCISASGGCLRYVNVRAPRPSLSKSAVAPQLLCDDCRGGCVTCWVLDDDSGAWAEEHMLRLADVWRENSYLSTGLPKEVPEFPLVDPLDPNILYLSIKEGLHDDGLVFDLNLSTRQVQSCSNSYKGLYNGNDGLEPVFTSGASFN